MKESNEGWLVVDHLHRFIELCGEGFIDHEAVLAELRRRLASAEELTRDCGTDDQGTHDDEAFRLNGGPSCRDVERVWRAAVRMVDGITKEGTDEDYVTAAEREETPVAKPTAEPVARDETALKHPNPDYVQLEMRTAVVAGMRPGTDPHDVLLLSALVAASKPKEPKDE